MKLMPDPELLTPGTHTHPLCIGLWHASNYRSFAWFVKHKPRDWASAKWISIPAVSQPTVAGGNSSLISASRLAELLNACKNRYVIVYIDGECGRKPRGCTTCPFHSCRCVPLTVRHGIVIPFVTTMLNWATDHGRRQGYFLDMTPWQWHGDASPAGIEYGITPFTPGHFPVWPQNLWGPSLPIKGEPRGRVPETGFSREVVEALLKDCYRFTGAERQFTSYSVEWDTSTRGKRLALITGASTEIGEADAQPRTDYEYFKVGPRGAIKAELINWERVQARLVRVRAHILYDVVSRPLSESPSDYAAAMRTHYRTVGDDTPGQLMSWRQFVVPPSDPEIPDLRTLADRLNALRKLFKARLGSALGRFHGRLAVRRDPEKLSNAYCRVLPYQHFAVMPVEQLARAMNTAPPHSRWKVFMVDPKTIQGCDQYSGANMPTGTVILQSGSRRADAQVRVTGDFLTSLWANGIIEDAGVDMKALGRCTKPYSLVATMASECAEQHGIAGIPDKRLVLACVDCPDLSFTNPLRLLGKQWESRFPWVQQAIAEDIHGDCHLGNMISWFEATVPVEAIAEPVLFIDVADTSQSCPAAIDYAALEMSIKIDVLEKPLTAWFQSRMEPARAVTLLTRVFLGVERALWAGLDEVQGLTGLDAASRRLIRVAYKALRDLRQTSIKGVRDIRTGPRPTQAQGKTDLAQALFFVGLGTLRYAKKSVSRASKRNHPLAGLVTAGCAADVLC